MIRDLFQIYTPLFLQTIVWPIGWIITRVFLRIEIKGYENIKHLKTPVIFAVNHTSELDPIIVTAVLPPLSPMLPMFYTSRDGKFYNNIGLRAKIFYGKWFFKAWGAYPVRVGLNDYEKSLKHHVDILLCKKGSVCIFPEGTRTKNGDLSPARGGVAYLAHKTSTPVVPVAISGVFKMTTKDFFLMKRKVRLVFGSPAYSQEFFKGETKITPDKYKEHAQEIMDAVDEISPK